MGKHNRDRRDIAGERQMRQGGQARGQNPRVSAVLDKLFIGKTSKKEVALLMERKMCKICHSQIKETWNIRHPVINGVPVDVHKVCPEKVE